MIEQVGRGDEQDRFFILQARIADRRRQMRFAAAISAFEQQPAFGLFGVGLRGFQRRLQRLQLRRRQHRADRR